MSQSGRPLSGFARPGSQQSARPGTMEQALRTPRTAHTARPVTATSARYVRLGTVSMHYSVCSLRRRQYVTIWDAVLMCNQKLTLVSIIYRMEPTNEKWKTEKLKSKKNGYAQKYR